MSETTPEATVATAAYDAFAADFHAWATRDANACAYLGLRERLGELPDPSLAAADDDVRAAEALIARANALLGEEVPGAPPTPASGAPPAFSFDQALDIDLARLMLRARAYDLSYRFNDRTMRQQLPSAGDDISRGIFFMFVNDPRPAGDRLADITARIEAVPRFLGAMLARLDTPVRRWVAIDLDKVAGLPDLFATLGGWAREVEWADTPRLDRATTAANEAIDRYAAGLGALPTTDNLHVGDAIAREIVRLRGIEPSFEDLHAMATRFLADTTAAIEELRARLCAKYGLAADTTTDALHAFLKQKYQVAPAGTPLERILERYEQERDKILAFCKQRDLFPILDEQDMRILRTPGFLTASIPAGAMEPPPPFRQGVRTSLVYLTLSEELRAEHSELDIPNMMIHEGIPGHHLQLATASSHPSVIRRHVNANEHAEGWTTMLEDYMLDIGYMGDLTDEARFCGKRDICRIGARVAIDLYFMTGERDYLDVGVGCDISDAGDAGFRAPGNLLAAVTGFVPGRVHAELNWNSQERAYPLSYLTGNALVWQLKRDMASKLAGKLAGEALDREFHRLYLESGNMPLSFLRRVFRHHGMVES